MKITDRREAPTEKLSSLSDDYFCDNLISLLRGHMMTFNCVICFQPSIDISLSSSRVGLGSSVVLECWTRNQMSPGSNPQPFCSLGIFVLSTTPLLTHLFKWVPGYRRWWKCEWLVIARNCCMARMLPREAELASEWTGLPDGGGAKYKLLWVVQRTGYCAI